MTLGRAGAQPAPRSTEPTGAPVRGPRRLGYAVAVLAVLFAVRITAPTELDLGDAVQDFLTLSISVIIESLPFVILGIGLSVVVHAVAEPSIAVITADDAKAGRLTVGPVDGSEPTRTLVDNADIGQLQSSGRAGMFGFVARPLSGPDQDLVQLQLYDPTTGGT